MLEGKIVLPESVQQLILSRIESVAQLEALLLMRRSTGRGFTPAELASQLYIKEKEAASVLTALSNRGLCVGTDGSYRYQPESEELEQQVAELAETYREKLILVTKLIHQRAAKPAAQSFADVFRFRKEE